jgi:hypothetical protein
MNTNFKNFIEISNYVNKHGAIIVPEHFQWAKEISNSLPSLGLDLPVVEKRAKIDLIMDKKNPIYVQLSDGSKLFFSLDEFRRIDGNPERGKTMIVTMQRLSHDNSELPSQIIKCQVI